MRDKTNALLNGLAISILGILLILTPPGYEFEQNIGLDGLFKLRGPIPAPPEVMVIAITDQTGEQLKVSKLPREWPRTLHARLVENLTRAGAAAIVFDMDFQTPKITADDERFGQAMAQSGRVTLVEKLTGKRQPLTNAEGTSVGSVWLEQLTEPIPQLAAAAKGLGPFPLPKMQVAVHEFWAFKNSVDAATMPVIAFQIISLPNYPLLAGLISQTGITPPPPPPPEARANELRQFMHQLRAVFREHPDLSQQLTQRVNGPDLAPLSPAQRKNLNAQIALYGGEDNRLLNFYGPPGTITTLPYALFAAEPGAAAAPLPDLHGKTVFVGFSDLFDPGQPDRFFTVYSDADGVDLSGVEIAATAYGNLLNNQILNPVGISAQILLVGGFGLLAGVSAYLLPALIGVPAVLAAASLYTYAAYNLFIEALLWLPLATPLLLQTPLALITGLLGQYLLERKHKNRVAAAIGLYLPQNLAKAYTQNRIDENALNRVTYCVCLASDMAGFTVLSEQLSPQALAEFLNQYFESLSAPLRQHGVDVIEFRADGIMCAWTAEQPNAETRRKALQAALGAVTAINEFKQNHPGHPLALRIGLEAGMAYVGHAGGGGHFVYSIVGDCANTAARIEGLNKKIGAQVLLNQNLTEGISGFLTRYIGEFQFVGKTEALPVAELVATSASATAEQIDLCARFAVAMQTLAESGPQAGMEHFAELRRDYPQDGPSQFWLTQCLHMINQAQIPERPALIRLDSK